MVLQYVFNNYICLLIHYVKNQQRCNHINLAQQLQFTEKRFQLSSISRSDCFFYVPEEGSTWARRHCHQRLTARVLTSTLQNKQIQIVVLAERGSSTSHNQSSAADSALCRHFRARHACRCQWEQSASTCSWRTTVAHWPCQQCTLPQRTEKHTYLATHKQSMRRQPKLCTDINGLYSNMPVIYLAGSTLYRVSIQS